VNHITPASIQKNIDAVLASPYEADYVTLPAVAEEEPSYMTPESLDRMIDDLREKMVDAAAKLEFEEAARYRDRISALEKRGMEVFGE
jgi:excinuclease ABC subunit B